MATTEGTEEGGDGSGSPQHSGGKDVRKRNKKKDLGESSGALSPIM